MAQIVRNKRTGEVGQLFDNGEFVPSEEPGYMVQAVRQMADLASGAQAAAGTVLGQDEWVRDAYERTAERNEVFAGADEGWPIQSMVGQAIPSLLTAPITGGSSLAGQVGASMAIGAAESALDLGQGGTAAGRGAAGAVGGLVGDVGGRVLGRVMNGARGLVDDIRLGRGAADNPRAQQAEDMGMELLGSQRARPGTPEQRTLERLEQGAEASMFSPGLQESAEATNQALFKNRVLEAVGLEAGSFDELGPDMLRQANAQISEGFQSVADSASAQGPIDVGEELAERILNTKGQIKDLRGRGRFQGLDDGILSGSEWNVARRALAADAANAAARGEYELADDIFADVEQLDRIMEERIGPEVLEQFARLREQYRNFKLVSKQGVIKSDGDVSIRNLNRALQAGTGYGTTAQQGLGTVNPETSELIELARIASSPEFQPFRSSGTAENLSAQRIAGAALNPLEWASLVGEAAMPAAVGATSTGGGRAVTGALTPAPASFQQVGSNAGRGFLDELFYPFVGAEDDRQP